MRVLGVDHGEKRVGLALADEEAGIAHPHSTLQRGDPAALLETIRAFVVEHEVEAIVVGLPLTLEGKEGASARRARRFAEKLGALTGIEVSLLDERMTSVAAERSLSEMGVRGGRRKAVVDQVAAALLLQSYLDQGRETAWHVTDEPQPGEPPPKGGGRGRRRKGRSRGR